MQFKIARHSNYMLFWRAATTRAVFSLTIGLSCMLNQVKNNKTPEQNSAIKFLFVVLVSLLHRLC